MACAAKRLVLVAWFAAIYRIHVGGLLLIDIEVCASSSVGPARDTPRASELVAQVLTIIHPCILTGAQPVLDARTEAGAAVILLSPRHPGTPAAPGTSTISPTLPPSVLSLHFPPSPSCRGPRS
jgi:hypothetical protein